MILAVGLGLSKYALERGLQCMGICDECIMR